MDKKKREKQLMTLIYLFLKRKLILQFKCTKNSKDHENSICVFICNEGLGLTFYREQYLNKLDIRLTPSKCTLF